MKKSAILNKVSDEEKTWGKKEGELFSWHLYQIKSFAVGYFYPRIIQLLFVSLFH